MADLIEGGTRWLADMLNRHAAPSVTYARGLDSAVLRAVIVQQPLTVSDGMGGLGTVFDNFDVLVNAADLILGGAPAEPVAGDRVTLASGVVYEVMAPPGEAVWRWADSYRVKRRIHSRQISAG